MAQHHGAGFPGFPGYPQPAYPPSMDAMANAPFDDVIHHINNVNYQLAHVHHQLHQQMHHFHHGLPMQLAPSHPPPTFQHNVHQFNNFHRNMMTHNIHIHQAMQDMARMQSAMVDAMNQNLMTVHSVHTNYAIQGRVPVPMMHHHPHVHPAARANHHDYESMLRLDESVKKKGVSEADLAKLKRVKFSTREKCKQCGICQENFAVGTKVISLPCKHIYCEEEILTWFDQHKTCPTCRHVVENVEAY